MPLEAYFTLIALLILGIIIVYWKIIKFHQYDYRENERNDLNQLPETKPENPNDDKLPERETDDWLDEWYYDQETKSFKQR